MLIIKPDLLQKWLNEELVGVCDSENEASAISQHIISILQEVINFSLILAFTILDFKILSL